MPPPSQLVGCRLSAWTAGESAEDVGEEVGPTACQVHVPADSKAHVIVVAFAGRPTRPVTTPLLALLVPLLLALLVPAARGLLPDEARAEADQLLVFKDGFINGAVALSSWVGEDACAGTWQGVVCLVGHVTEL